MTIKTRHTKNANRFVSTIMAAFMASLFCLGSATAQEAPPIDSHGAGGGDAPAVTAVASGRRVRYVSIGEVQQTRLQVFSSSGTQVYDSGLRLGNLVVWQLQDQQGAALTDGTYLFLVTAKDFAGRLTQKYGTANLEQGQVYLEQGSRDDLTSVQTTTLEANRLSETLSPVDRVGAEGSNTTIASNDNTPGTNTTESPESAPPGENLGGTGTQNMVAKWIDNADNLGNSILFDDGAGVGVGTTDLTDVLLAGNDKFKAVDGPMTLSFRDFFTGQGYLAIGSTTNGIKGFVGHTNTMDGFTLGTFSNHKLTIRTNSVNRLLIDTNGNLGLNTTDLTDILVGGNDRFKVVDGPMSLGFKDFSSGQGFLAIGSTSNGIKGIIGHTSNSDGFTFGSASAHKMTLRTNSINRMTIDAAGNVGIGTTSPNTLLDLNGALSVRGTAAPAVAPAGQGRIFFDSATNAFQVSQNGGAYTNLVSGGGSANIGPPYTWVCVPAHFPVASSTIQNADLSIFNASGSTANVTVNFLRKNGTVLTGVTIPGGGGPTYPGGNFAIAPANTLSFQYLMPAGNAAPATDIPGSIRVTSDQVIAVGGSFQSSSLITQTCNQIHP